MAFLEGLNAPDLGIFIAGEDFAATQDFSEEFNQNVNYRGALGHDGPVLRTVRRADEDRVSFTAVLLKNGVARGMNDEEKLKAMRDFEIMTRRGDKRKVYRNVNWTQIRVTAGQDEVTLAVDMSVPGFTD